MQTHKGFSSERSAAVLWVGLGSSIPVWRWCSGVPGVVFQPISCNVH